MLGMSQKWAVGILSTAILSGVGFGTPSMATELQDLYNVRPYNATQKPERRSADEWVQIGNQALESGSIQLAVAAWNEALEMYRTSGDVAGQGRIYQLMGMTYAKRGYLAEADQIFRKTLAIARDNRDVQGQIYALNNIGTILLQYRSLAEAQRTFEEALTVARSVQHTVGQGLSLSNLGLAAFMQGRYRDAIAFYELAKPYRDLSQDALGSANTMNSLGEAYRAVGDYQASFIAHRQAMFLAQQAKDRTLEFRALDGQISAYQGWGQQTNLADALNRRLALSTEINSPAQVLISLKAIAQYHRLKKDFVKTESYYQQALAVAKTIGASQDQDWLIAQIGELQSRKYLR
jgi:tetratricopeptide (TPR) repeat protein